MRRTARPKARPRAIPAVTTCKSPGWRVLLPSGSLDLEAVDVVLGLGGIEGLAHDRERLAGRGRRREADLLHQFRGVGGEIDLLGDGGIVDVALDLPPAF